MGVSVNVIWVTSQGPCGERVHQFQMFSILQYIVKAHNFRSIARQPELTWQAVCTQIVVRGLKFYQLSMKRIRSPSTELLHILAVYIRSLCDFDL